MEKLYQKMLHIAGNLWWSWQPEFIDILRELDEELWRRCNHNALAFLRESGPGRLEERARELAIESRVIYAYHRLQEYLDARRGWGRIHAGPLRVRPVAYFCAEFGLHESLPLYSGGLGVLAGDHLKAASDLGVPMVGVGLFYDQGYFRRHWPPTWNASTEVTSGYASARKSCSASAACGHSRPWVSSPASFT